MPSFTDKLKNISRKFIDERKIKKAFTEPSVKSIASAAYEVVGSPTHPLTRISLGEDKPNPDYARRPSADSKPDDIRAYIDKVIGKNERDDDIVRFLTDIYPRFSKMVEAPASLRVGSTLYPNTDDMHARLATGNIPKGRNLDPYSPLDQKILGMIQGDERMTQLYLRETEPDKLLPFLPPELNARKQKTTLWSTVRDGVGDLAGRPIGAAIDALSWPSDQVEMFFGQKFVWNDVKDPWMRRQLGKYSYEFGLAAPRLTLWGERRTKAPNIIAAANDIEARGLTGDEAWKALQPSLASNMSTYQAAFGFVASATMDPLNVLSPFVKGAAFGVKTAGRAAIGAERAEALGRAGQLFGKAPRVLGPGRELLGGHTMKEILAADELTYQGWRVARPPRGPMLRLFEQNPSGFAAETVRRLNNVFARNDSLTPEAIAIVDRALSTGKLDDEAIALVGNRFFDDPRIARFTQLMRRDNETLGSLIFGKDAKKAAAAQARLADLASQLGPNETGAIMRKLVVSHIEDYAAKAQEKLSNRFVMRRVRPIVNAEKAVMGVLSLSRPSFIMLNAANNLFTYMWHANPMNAADYLKTWGQSMFTQATTGLPTASYPQAFRDILNWADISPAVAEDIIQSGSSAGDLLSLRAKNLIRGELGDIDDSSDLVNWAKQLDKNPAKIRDDFSIRSLLAWPVSMASRVDIATKRATYMMSLKEQRHWALRPNVLTPQVKATLIEKGFDPDQADLVTNKMVSRIRDEASKGTPVFRPEEMERVFRDTIADLGDDIISPNSGLDYMTKWAAERGMVGDQAWPYIGVLQDIESKVNEVLDDLPDLSQRARNARLQMIADDIYDFDYVQSILTNSQPVLRKGFDYQSNLRLTEDSLRSAMVDDVGHLERLFSQVYAGRWNGKLRRGFYEGLTGNLNSHMDELAEIRRVGMEAEAADLPRGEMTRDLWDQFWVNKQERLDAIYKNAREVLGEVHSGPLEHLEKWYDSNKAISARHQEILKDALAAGDKDDWAKAGSAIKNLYLQQARKNADIFGWSANQPPTNHGHQRPSALMAMRADDFVDWMKTRINQEMIANPPGAADRSSEIKKQIREINRAFRPPKPGKVDEVVSTGLRPAVEKRWRTQSGNLQTRADELKASLEAPPPASTTTTATLPRELAGAKPRYRQFEVEFESDLDRAAYITAQPKRSRADDKYLNFVLANTGLSEGEVRAAGRQIRDAMKSLEPEDGTLKVSASTLNKAPAKPSPDLDAFNAQRVADQAEFDKVQKRLADIELKLNPPAPEPEQLAKFVPENAAELKAQKEALRAELRKLVDESPGREAAQARRAMLATIEDSVPALSAQGGDIAQLVRANAMAKTDFVMLNYNQQYGMDNAMQAFFPYMFFPTRTLVNWGKRMAKAPGMGALLAKSLAFPEDYNEVYGYPERMKHMIPVPMPFLDDIMEGLPIAGKMMQEGKFENRYWVDPMQMLFPMTGYTRDYDDDKRKSTPLGQVADWMENYTGMGLNPVAKILGSETGLLDKEAWEQSMFSGGPFGIPMTAAGRAVAGWLQNGETEGVPEEEMDNYSNGGFFSPNLLTRILGLTNERFDVYRSERALWSMVAQGDLDSDEAWKAMLEHKGGAWRKAVRASQGEQFLREFTGSIFARVTSIQEGEFKMKMGIKQAFNAAQTRGPDAVKEFYARFPEYQGYQVAVRGLSDPGEREKAVETEIYYKTVHQYAEQPYQLRLDRLDEALTMLQYQTQTEATRDQIKVLKEQRAAINLEKKAIRSMIEKSFPNRETELSINRDPYERALAGVRGGFYGLLDDETPLTDDEVALVRRVTLHDNPSNKDVSQMRKLAEREAARQDKDFTDLDAAQKAYLRQFPPKESAADPRTWHNLTVESLTTKLRYGTQMDAALKVEDFDTYRKLQAERNGRLEAIHDRANGQVTRWDVENYMNRFERPPSPEEEMFEQANGLFDLWMSLVGDGSVLSGRQKAAVSEYFRSRPEIKKHYHSSSIELFKTIQTKEPISISAKGRVSGGKVKEESVLRLAPEQLYALQRRREIWRTYYDMETDEAQLDYMSQTRRELNQINALLGMGALQVIDFADEPPYSQLGNADNDFRRDVFMDRQIQDLAQKGNKLTDEEQLMLSRLTQQRDPAKLSEREIDHYVRLSMQRGY